MDMSRRLIHLAMLVIGGWTAVGCSSSARLVVAPAAGEFDPFYAKMVDAGGIPILSSANVGDRALIAAKEIVLGMLEGRDDLRDEMIRNGARVAIIGVDELTTDMPEHRLLYEQYPGTDWDTRARGLGATKHIPLTSVGEENVLGLQGDRYAGESILIHEFAHSILNIGIESLDPSFRVVLDKRYRAAMEQGLWSNTYAATDRGEYWAEGVQSYFDAEREATPANGIHNHVNTRKELAEYDPGLHDLIQREFRVSELLVATPFPAKGLDEGVRRGVWTPFDRARADGRPMQGQGV